MKKAYISPTSEAFDLRVEAMMATSFPINNSEADQWSNKNEGGWDCGNWSNADEDME
ncbi:MAG: hypothetical protein MR624_04235 [Bacteroidales bacterium]|nr:hypothetical protein [Bacteroidales bacterium]